MLPNCAIATEVLFIFKPSVFLSHFTAIFLYNCIVFCIWNMHLIIDVCNTKQSLFFPSIDWTHFSRFAFVFPLLGWYSNIFYPPKNKKSMGTLSSCYILAWSLNLASPFLCHEHFIYSCFLMWLITKCIKYE